MYVTKRPHNVIEGPIYPFIQKDPPRFYKTKKHWVVHPDDIIRKQEDNTQLIDSYVLSVSRDENKRRYGQRSYYPKVNKEFRPPLVDPEYDIVPLSRIPRPRTRARINPEGPAKTQNIHGIDVSSKIDERVLKGAIRPTYTIAFEKPPEQILPDLQLKMPQVGGNSAVNTPFQMENDRQEFELDRRNPEVYGSAGMNTPLDLCQTSPLEDLDLDLNMPPVIGRSGINTPVNIDQTTPLEDLLLDHNAPKVQGKSGINTPTTMNAQTPLEDLDLSYGMPQVSGSSGMNTPYGVNQSHANEYMQLNFNNPQTSFQTNPSNPVQIQDYTPQNIVTNNPIQLPYHTTPNYGVQYNSHNENPNMKQTLDYNRNCTSNPNIPSGLQHINPTLKTKPKPMMYGFNFNGGFNV